MTFLDAKVARINSSLADRMPGFSRNNTARAFPAGGSVANVTKEPSAPYYISLDVEAKGLYGTATSFGMVLYSPDGSELDSSYGQLPYDKEISNYPSKGDFDWVTANVVRLPVTAADLYAMLDSFCHMLQHWLSKYESEGSKVYLMADNPHPVESLFLVQARNHWEVVCQKGQFKGMYPIIDVASILLASGQDPTATYPRLPGELPAHQPLNDARQSARLFFEAMQMIASK